MKTTRALYWGVAAVATALVAACAGQMGSGSDGSVGASDIGGVVSGPRGPEAGVWVVAETTDLPTKYAKVVVTDDKGRYLIPELPKAKYSVWSRGYGLRDSAKASATPGSTVNFNAEAASDKEAAELYPGMYWYSMLNIPATNQFPGTGDKGNGISSNIK